MKSFSVQLFIIALLLSNALATQAQGFYFTWGYGGNATSMKGMNAIVENYNETRQWLDKDMKKFGYLDGFTTSLGFGVNNAWFEMEMAFRGQKRKASGTDLSGNSGSRSLKFKNNAFGFTVGGIGGEDNFLVGGGIRLDIGAIRLKTKVNVDNQDNEGWEKVGSSDVIARVGPAVKFVIGSSEGAAFTIGFNYGFDILKANLYEWDEFINNTSYGYPGPDKFNIKTHAFGFTLMFGLAGST